MDKRKGFDECACEECYREPTPGNNYCDEHTPGTAANLALRERMSQCGVEEGK